MRYPNEPEDSCPHIDWIIEELEKTRKINETLREDAQRFYTDLCEAETKIGLLEERVDDLEDQLNETMKELKELR